MFQNPVVIFSITHNGDGMLRAALETVFLSAVTNLIGIANLSTCASLPPEIYRMLALVFYCFHIFSNNFGQIFFILSGFSSCQVNSN